MNGGATSSKLAFFAALSALAAALFYAGVSFPPESGSSNSNPDLKKKDKVLTALLSLEEKLSGGGVSAKIAVGYGACKDIFVQGYDILADKRPKNNEVRNHNEIQTWDHLLEMYGYFFSHGAAAE